MLSFPPAPPFPNVDVCLSGGRRRPLLGLAKGVWALLPLCNSPALGGSAPKAEGQQLSIHQPQHTPPHTSRTRHRGSMRVLRCNARHSHVTPIAPAGLCGTPRTPRYLRMWRTVPGTMAAAQPAACKWMRHSISPTSIKSQASRHLEKCSCRCRAATHASSPGSVSPAAAPRMDSSTSTADSSSDRGPNAGAGILVAAGAESQTRPLRRQHLSTCPGRA